MAITNGTAQAAIVPHAPVTARALKDDGTPIEDERLVTIELEDGTAYQGYSFGAHKSVSGELVFQTGRILQLVRRVRTRMLTWRRNGGVSRVRHGPFI